MRLTDRADDSLEFREALISEELPRRLKVLNSWKRCLAYGVDPYKPADNLLVPPRTLVKILEANRVLTQCAMPEMKQLLENLGETEPGVVLTDAEGVMIASHNVADHPLFRDNPGCAVGSHWGEKVAGTNAIALALAEREACFLLSGEHFVHDDYSWTCFASPIFGLKGETVGALSLIYGHEAPANAEIMALVINAARAVELNYNRRSYQPRDVLDHLARDLSALLFEAFFIIDEGRRVHYLNRAAADFFGLPSGESAGRDLAELVPLHNEPFWALVRQGGQAFGQSLVLAGPGGDPSRGRRVTANFLPVRELDHRPEEAGRQPAKGLVIVFKPAEDRGRQSAGPALVGRARTHFSDLVGRSDIFRAVLEEAALIARTEANVVLLGESGVGKDLFAQSLHNAGRRRAGPYYAINCAAIPRELLSSELFGYEEGAFTGARKGGNPGKLELAHGGTLLLDEIGEMSAHLQAYLLRAIESRDIMRLGGGRILRVDTRIICATNRNLEQAILTGEFRADLYYRLAVTTIVIPPLRERREDIPLLLDHHLDALAGSSGGRVRYSPALLDCLMAYDYPGNIRELKNAVERAVILARGGTLEPRFLPPAFLADRTPPGPAAPLEPAVEKLTPAAELEMRLIRDHLEKFRHNKSRAAEALGISRNNLYRKMRRYGLG